MPGFRRGDHIFVSPNSKFFRVNFSEILYVEGMKDYLKIHTPIILGDAPDDECAGEASAGRLFIRVHRSYWYRIGPIKTIYWEFHRVGEDDDTDWGKL